MTKEKTTVTDSLEDDDWALIINSKGDLKGVYIPHEADEKDVPEAIVEILEQYYNIDFYDNDDNTDEHPKTVH